MNESPHEIQVRWLPFQLRANIPPGGVPKGGTPESRVPARMKAAGAAAGIDFTGKCDRYPNSLAAHALLRYAADLAPSKQSDLQEVQCHRPTVVSVCSNMPINLTRMRMRQVLFRQYFTDGLYPDGETLAAAAKEVGLDAVQARAYAESQDNQRLAAEEARAISMRGVSGVPFFFINGEPALSGAQPPHVLTAMINEAAE